MRNIQVLFVLFLFLQLFCNFEIIYFKINELAAVTFRKGVRMSKKRKNAHSGALPTGLRYRCCSAQGKPAISKKNETGINDLRFISRFSLLGFKIKVKGYLYLDWLINAHRMMVWIWQSYFHEGKFYLLLKCQELKK